MPDNPPNVASDRSIASADVWARLPRPLTGASVIAAALTMTGAATFLGVGLSRMLPQPSVSLVYLVAVVMAAVGLGVRTGLAVAFGSFLAYNFFFIPPVFSFTIADPQEFFALLVFLGVALLTGSLAGRMREVADDARRRATALQSLNEFAGMLSGSRDVQAILDTLATHAAQTVRGEAVVLTKALDELEIKAFSPRPPTMDSLDVQAARRAFRTGEIEHRAAMGWPSAQFEFHPLKTKTAILGVIGLVPGDGERGIRVEDPSSIEIMLQHAAIAIERAQLESDALRARGETERERLRSALLSSLSHDLKTPLASILGAVTSLRELGSAMSAETHADLLAAIEEETRRLSHFVANLLQMTRLESGDLNLLGDWIDLADVVRIAVNRARRIAPGMIITMDCPSMLPALRGDATLVEHVIFNILDNAIKFSRNDQKLDVVLSADERAISITVTDMGSGIPPDALTRIFEPFFRVREGVGEVSGTGLGLTICKRIVDGMGGTIEVQSPVSGANGTRVSVTLPVPIEATASQPDGPQP